MMPTQTLKGRQVVTICGELALPGGKSFSEVLERGEGSDRWERREGEEERERGRGREDGRREGRGRGESKGGGE